MKPVLLIFAVTLSGVLATQNVAVGGTGAAVATEESRTKPESAPLPKESLNLAAIPYQIVYETRRETKGKENCELCLMKADGSGWTNLTNTPDVDEMYPHVSPDGTKICFVTDEGEGDKKVRHVYYMNLDGSRRVHVAAHARDPCWSFDSKSIAYLNDEYERFSSREYATSGLTYYHLDKNWRSQHPNTKLEHLYAICWSPDSKWFVGAVEGGMGYSDTIIAFEAFGTRVFDLAKWGVKGCRPDLSRDGTRMVWGETDWNLRTGEIDLKGAGAQGHEYPRHPALCPEVQGLSRRHRAGQQAHRLQLRPVGRRSAGRRPGRRLEHLRRRPRTATGSRSPMTATTTKSPTGCRSQPRIDDW